MSTNPYESPIDLTPSNAVPKAPVPLSKLAFWLGFNLSILGSFITFYPGVETGWIVVSAIFITFGLSVPDNKYRVAALLLIAFSFFAAYAGIHRGIEYQVWLETRP